MTSNLQHILVERRLATERVVEDVSARQTLFGADWLTNLIELESVDEVQAVAALGEVLGMPPGPVGTLPPPSEAASGLIPGSMATRHHFYPLSADAATLTICVGTSLANEVIEEIEFTLQVKVVQNAVLNLRVLEALRRDYGYKLDYRHTRALAKLLGNPDPDPSAPPPAVFHGGMSMIPRPPIVPEELVENLVTEARLPAPERDASVDFPYASGVLHPVGESAEEDAGGGTRAGTSGDGEQRPLTVQSPSATLGNSQGTRRRGPYSLVQALSDLYAAQTSTRAFEVFVEFSRQFFDYVALFLIQGDFAEGHDARGAGASRQVVRTLGVSLSLPSSLRRVYEAKAPLVIELEEGGLDAKLREDLGRRQRHVLCLPVLVAGRAVAILYADHEGETPELGAAADVVTCAQRLGQALELLIVRRKRGSAISPKPPRAQPAASESRQSQSAEPPADSAVALPRGEQSPNESAFGAGDLGMRSRSTQAKAPPMSSGVESAPASEMRPAVPSINIDVQSFPRLVEAAVGGVAAAGPILARRPALALLELARHLAHQQGPEPAPEALEPYARIVRQLPPDTVIPAERLAEESLPVRACIALLKSSWVPPGDRSDG